MEEENPEELRLSLQRTADWRHHSRDNSDAAATIDDDIVRAIFGESLASMSLAELLFCAKKTVML